MIVSTGIQGLDLFLDVQPGSPFKLLASLFFPVRIVNRIVKPINVELFAPPSDARKQADRAGHEPGDKDRQIH